MATPSTVRQINERRALDALLRAGPMTRAELGRELGLMRSTAGNLIVNLARAGLVKDAVATGRERGAARTGRPGSLVELNGAHAVFLGAEIGVGRIRIIGIDLGGRVVCRGEDSFDADHLDPPAVVELLAANLRSLHRRTAAAQVRGLAMTVAGLVSAHGRVIRAPLLGWRDVSLRRLVEARLTGFSPIMTENDANAFAMAELSRAAAAPAADAVYILLDVGVGGGIVATGALVRGTHGSAGEIGHVPLHERGGTPGSALAGSLESFVGVRALLADFVRHGGRATTLLEFLAAVRRQQTARAALQRWARHLGRGLAVLCAVLDPDRFVLGGPAAILLDECGDEVGRALGQALLPSQRLPSIMISRLGEDAPALGAAIILQRRFLADDPGPGHRGELPATA